VQTAHNTGARVPEYALTVAARLPLLRLLSNSGASEKNAVLRINRTLQDASLLLQPYKHDYKQHSLSDYARYHEF
jgi:hypothetical protein